MLNILELAGKAQERNESVVLCTVVRSEGSTPRHVGSKMLVFADGHFVGSVGGGELEHRVLEAAGVALRDEAPRLLKYNLTDPGRGDPGVCGGQVEVLVEPLLPPATILVIGAGHVGKAVAHLAKWLQFRVIVSDDREEECNASVIPDADAHVVCAMNELPTRTVIDERTYIVLTTRGSSLDVEGLPALLATGAAYLGVIGSRRRWATTLQGLTAAGVPQSLLDRVHSPMGLELHAETPEEIAVSILAEILMIRGRGTGTSMGEPQRPARGERP